jgi:Fur family ferric uptake transcriptional regulator
MEDQNIKKRRQTTQGDSIREVILKSERPLTVDEIHHLSAQKHPGLGIATVYRAVLRLIEEKVIQAVSFPGEGLQYYETCGTLEHHHFLCRKCDRAFCIDGIPLMWDRLVPGGFQLQNHQVTLAGLCKDCRAS